MSEPDGGLDAGTLGAIIGGSAAGLLIIIGVNIFPASDPTYKKLTLK
jgi:hypothetical protein